MRDWPWNFPQVSTRTSDHTEAFECEWQTIIRKQAARIEELEAALRRIRDDGKNCVDHCRRQADKALRTSARAALDKDLGK